MANIAPSPKRKRRKFWEIAGHSGRGHDFPNWFAYSHAAATVQAISAEMSIEK